MENGFIEQAMLTQTDQRRDRQLIVAGIPFKLIIETAQVLTELACLIFNFRT